MSGDQRIREVLAEHWAIEVRSSSWLKGELDVTVHVVDVHDQEYCLKVRPIGGESTREVSLELGALNHLASTGSLDVPRVRPTTSGEQSIVTDSVHVWVLDWIPGDRWADLSKHSASHQRQLGAMARELSNQLSTFKHPAAERTHHWDLRHLERAIRKHLDSCPDEEARTIAEKALRLIAERVDPVIDKLPTSIIHQDLNDHNVILLNTDDGEGSDSAETPSLACIDFGDVLVGPTVAELAVAMAYAMLRTPAAIDAATNVAVGWFADREPTSDELSVLFPMAFGRLVVNALTWAARSEDQPEYARERSSHTWATLRLLREVPAAFIEERIRIACGGDVTPLRAPTSDYRTDLNAVPVVNLDPRRDIFDGIDVQDADSLLAAGVPEGPFVFAHAQIRIDRGDFGSGRGGPRTLQAGIEICGTGGQPIAIALDGVVIESNERRVVVRHDMESTWWSCWCGFDQSLATGDHVRPGDVVGVAREDRPSFVQLLKYRPDPADEIARLVRPSSRAPAWRLSADPSVVLGIDPSLPDAQTTPDDILALRESRLASSQRSYYSEPMALVRAHGVRLVDSDGQHYLDVINNVTHVGHGNEHVANAASKQMRRLNTNSRFVYEEMGDYANRLVGLLPGPLEVVFLVCTGSEANDLAIRIAREVTGRTNVMVVDGAYHGNTGVVTGISPNRYDGPGGSGAPPTTHSVMCPDRYRGPYGYSDLDAGERYAADVEAVVRRLVAADEPPAAFIAESLMGTAGQIVYPPGYLERAFDHARAAGALCISDEVQVGFGRLGETFWGFERGGVVPDIVTMGKPMGNGYPVAAVVTTREIADAFDQGMKYFNTFGGNPVACAAGSAVLDEIERLDLQNNARQVGGYFLAELKVLMDQYEVIGDVRGEGLYLGVEFVLDRESKAPAKAFTLRVCERLRELGVIMYPNGRLGNNLKIKPPMIFTESDVDHFVGSLAAVLDELSAP